MSDLLCCLSYVYVQNVICLSALLVGREQCDSLGFFCGVIRRQLEQRHEANEAAIVVWRVTPLQFRKLPRLRDSRQSDWAELRLEEKPSFRDVLTEACLSLYASVDKADLNEYV